MRILEHDELNRRGWIKSAGFLLAGALGVTLLGERAAAASSLIAITVHKDPSCGCCVKWVKHLSANGFAPVVRDRTDMDSFKDSLSIPPSLRSCHTAIAGKLMFEGHVPASDIKRLLTTTPKGTVGLAVPGMPSGSPGMENGRSDRYDVIAFRADGTTRVFSSHA